MEAIVLTVDDLKRSVLVERIVSAYWELRRWPPQSVLVNAGNSS